MLARTFIVGGLVFFLAGSVASEPSTSLGDSKISARLAAELDSSETLHRVQVSLRPEAFADSRVKGRAYGDAQGLKAIQQDVAKVLGRVLAQPPGGRFEVLFEYDSLYGFSAEADAVAIRALARHPDVEVVEAMPVWQPFFEESHPLTQVDDMHARGYTGDGVTVAGGGGGPERDRNHQTRRDGGPGPTSQAGGGEGAK
ncbi:MAG: hypothetical protein AAF604_07045, partial [Acidobacteriota bacterium]